VAEPSEAVVVLRPEPPDPCVPCPAPERVDLVTALIVEAGARFDDETIARVQQAMVEHCERRGDRLALLDPPAGLGPLDVGALRGWRARYDSSFACLHAPWLRVVEPLARRPGPPGRARRLPPSGHVAGLLARVDAEVGPWQAPANRTIRWAVEPDLVLDDDAHALLNDAGVDALRARPGRGVVALGARTLSYEPALRPLNVRRLLLHVNRAVRAALAWSVFEPAGEELDLLMATVMTGLAEGLWEEGALAGDTPGEAFQVRTGLGDRLAGQVVVELSLAPARANELILLRVSRTDNRLELSEQPERSA
jgi:phage tail sheath protein FI